jgi:sugar phosphate isomerase/epimerase
VRASVCSYSFHRSFEDGSLDLERYVAFCRDEGFTELDVWSRHLDGVGPEELRAAGVPVGSLAVDGADAWAPTEEERAEHRERTERWLAFAEAAGAARVRFNAGPFHHAFEPGTGSDELFEEVAAGFADLVARGRARGVEVLTENHWGPFQHPDELGRLLDAVPGLGLLFDTHNWPEGTQLRAWERYAPRARMTHFKTFAFDDTGRETTQDLERAVGLLRAAGYDGVWGVESVPDDGDEVGAAARTLALLRRLVE